MEWVLLVVIYGFPVFVLLSCGVYAYVDAPKYGMNPSKWALISVLVPIFGFFAYLFERDERTPDENREEMFTDGPFEIHKSRANDTPLASDEPGAETADGGEDDPPGQ